MEDEIEIFQSNQQDMEDEVETQEYKQNENTNAVVQITPNSPQCPYIAEGMEFKTVEEARLLYYAYAKYRGFGVRSSSTNMSKADKNLLIGKAFVCDKEGKKPYAEGDESRGIKRKRDIRTGCRARLRLCLVPSSGVWRVNTFDDNHNHQCVTPSQVGNIRSHRRYHLSEPVQNIVTKLHNEGISGSRIAKVVNAISGLEEIVITRDQCHAQLRKERQQYIGNECSTIIMKFQEEVKKDPMFWFSIDVDEKDNSLRSLFWVDGRSRKAYLEFSDILVFDVTYRTNKFLLPFAPFTGVNHHLQSSLFGCALIVNEKQETFEWLFREWLKSMFNVEPKVIITDQDLSICAAIKEVFPNSKHRYCSWHVKKHANEHLHLLNPCNSEFASDYYEWYNANTFEESDRLWKLLTEKYSKEKIKWLLSMHEKRKHWLPVHWADIFTAGMTSSQRSESINSFFDGYVHALTPLSEFVEQYNKALIARRKSEKEEDFASLNTTPKSESGLVWQEQAAKLYTRKIYAKFYEQFISSQAYYKDTESKNSGVACYKVGRDGFDKSTWRIVLHDSTCDTFTCSCKMFEREGIFCRHILAIFRLKQVRSIPDKYILRRWTIEARYRGTNISSSFCNQVSNSSTVSPLMLFSLQSKHQKYMKRVALSLSDYTLYDSWLSTQLASSESDMIVGCNKIGSSLPLHETSTSEVSLLVHDPAKPAITKGRPRIASRIKSGAELSLENKQIRQNKCSHCEGKGHNIAGCPIRKGKK